MAIDLLESIRREKGVAIVLTTTDLYESMPASRNYVLKDGALHEYLRG